MIRECGITTRWEKESRELKNLRLSFPTAVQKLTNAGFQTLLQVVRLLLNILFGCT